MVKLAIVSSKKYLKSKQAVDFLQYLNNQKISYEKLILEDKSYENTSKDTFNLIISIGGDGTALKAMKLGWTNSCLLYTSPSPRDRTRSRMPSSA